ncbi:MAG: acid--CoA ligase [Candidatus Aminicenantes bacterium]|nr:acid--CoA ligase [Candidatus Aminicenantes bacterium]
MKVAAFITDYLAVNQITDHLKLIFVARKSPPSHVIGHVFLKAAEERKEYF